MATTTFRGSVVDRGTKAGISGLRVEAWDARRRIKDLVAASDTDADGNFSVSLTDEIRDGLFGEECPALSFRVMSELTILANTERTLIWDAKAGGRGRIEVSPDRPIGSVAAVASTVIEGVVLDPGAGPMVEILVQAYAESLAGGTVTRTQVGANAETDARGRFRITYRAEGNAAPDVVVKATVHVDPFEYAEVHVARGAGRQFVTIVRGTDATREVNTYRTLLDRLTQAGGGDLVDIDDDGVRFLSSRADRSAQDVRHAVDAHTLHATYGVDDPEDPTPITWVSPEAFFGLIRSGVSSDPFVLFQSNR